MVATGRVPNTKTLGLENMGIETNRGFVQVRDASLFYFFVYFGCISLQEDFGQLLWVLRPHILYKLHVRSNFV